MTLIVSQLRDALEDLPGDLPVIFPAGDFDYQSAERASVHDVEWISAPSPNDPTMLRCLVIE